MEKTKKITPIRLVTISIFTLICILFYMLYLNIASDIVSKIIIGVTMAVLYGEGLHDYISATTVTAPIYIAILSIIAAYIALYAFGISSSMVPSNIWIYLISCVIYFGLSILLGFLADKTCIGAGDCDIYMLMYLTCPLFAIIALIASYLTFFKNWILEAIGKKKTRNMPENAENASEDITEMPAVDEASEAELADDSLLTYRIPFVPMLTILYMLVMVVFNSIMTIQI